MTTGAVVGMTDRVVVTVWVAAWWRGVVVGVGGLLGLAVMAGGVAAAADGTGGRSSGVLIANPAMAPQMKTAGPM